MADKVCTECRRLSDQYHECIEQAHDLRNQACDLELMPDRAKVFELVLSRLDNEAEALKKTLVAHQQCHPQESTIDI